MMPNNMKQFVKRESDVVSILPNVETRCLDSYSNHSVVRRLMTARTAGKDTLNLYRPRGSVLADNTTDEIISALREFGLKVTPSGEYTPGCRLYIVQGLLTCKL